LRKRSLLLFVAGRGNEPSGRDSIPTAVCDAAVQFDEPLLWSCAVVLWGRPSTDQAGKKTYDQSKD